MSSLAVMSKTMPQFKIILIGLGQVPSCVFNHA